MRVNYLIRLDDASPYMDRQKWQHMEIILDKYGIRPLVGIIPANSDKGAMIEPENVSFWDIVHLWENKGWKTALHGYCHDCIFKGGLKGMNPMWQRSEYAGASLATQREKIKNGYKILRSNGIKPNYFFAPSHTFDEKTIEALRLETDIRIISDTIGRYPYWKNDFAFIPQIAGHCVKMFVPGYYTYCFHPNSMSDSAFIALENFIKVNYSSFISFDDININNFGSKHNVDKLMSWVYFSIRRIRGIK